MEHKTGVDQKVAKQMELCIIWKWQVNNRHLDTMIIVDIFLIFHLVFFDMDKRFENHNLFLATGSIPNIKIKRKVGIDQNILITSLINIKKFKCKEISVVS